MTIFWQKKLPLTQSNGDFFTGFAAQMEQSALGII
jgi:hypothetical protein